MLMGRAQVVVLHIFEPLPEGLLKELRYFAKCIEPWLRVRLG